VPIVLALGDNTYGCVLASNVMLCCLVLRRNHYLGNTHQETVTDAGHLISSTPFIFLPSSVYSIIPSRLAPRNGVLVPTNNPHSLIS